MVPSPKDASLFVASNTRYEDADMKATCGPFLALTIGLFAAPFAAKAQFICALPNGPVAPMVGGQLGHGLPCVIATPFGVNQGRQIDTRLPPPMQLGGGPPPQLTPGMSPALPQTRYPYGGPPNQRTQDVMKLAECSGASDPYAFLGCFGAMTLQQECAEEGDCLEDAEETVKQIGYDIADIFDW